MSYSATYSPDDNKLRLYAMGRLPKETYERVRAAGFRWAPKQELFFAPMWTPAREDLLIELCGEIEDEDKSLVQRAEERAERFEGYSENRAKDAASAHKAVHAIADGIPLGQPILVGHHSEKHARKDAERIENGMRKAVKMWEASKYWESRAAGAIAHAQYKELPRVRAKRIKNIEAEQRKVQRNLVSGEKLLKTYNDPEAATAVWRDGRLLVPALLASWGGGLDHDDQRAFEKGAMTLEAAQAKAISNIESTVAVCKRWVAHYQNRLVYEKAMLEEQGATALLAPKPRRTQLPVCNYRAPGGISVDSPYHREPQYRPQVEMTKAEYAKINYCYKGMAICEGSHRVRTAVVNHGLTCVFLTDSKAHEKPEPVVKAVPAPKPVPAPRVMQKEQPNEFDAMRAQLKAGVKVVSAPQLFPTPTDLAARMVEEAGIEAGHRVLEPSAGTGRLVDALDAVPGVEVVAVEISHALADNLKLRSATRTDVRCADFLACNGDLGTFDRIIMNPPFVNGADIKHIQHAFHMLKPGGRLVALCANGPRQREALQPMVDATGGTWEDLPPDTFKESGTGVNVAMLVLEARG